VSIAAAHWAAFAREIARSGRVWTIRDSGGYPAPRTREGKRSQPFWSSIGRARRIIERVPAYRGFQPEEVSWEELRDSWLPGLERDGLLVGVNWSGSSAKGHDVTPSEVRARVEYELGRLSPGSP
jgi:hypothetical protein